MGPDAGEESHSVVGPPAASKPAAHFAAPGLLRVSRAMGGKAPRPLSQRTIAVQEFQKSSHGTVTRVKLITIKPNRDDAKAWSWQQYEEMTQRLGYKGVAGHSTNLWPRKKRVQRRPEPGSGVSR